MQIIVQTSKNLLIFVVCKSPVAVPTALDFNRDCRDDGRIGNDHLKNKLAAVLSRKNLGAAFLEGRDHAAYVS